MDIQDNITQLRNDITATCDQYDRNVNTVRLMAVSKKQADDRIDAALATGHRLYGENRVQEAQKRWTDRRKDYDDLELHLIGPLQTNKVKEAITLFDCIQTLDRPKLAKALSAEMDKQGKFIPCMIQVNTGEEDQKSGILPVEFPDFLALCQNEYGMTISGLMCIPPFDEPPTMHFALLQKMAATHGLRELSMGMSSDYAKAIPFGATLVRVGSAFFGARPAES